MEWKLSWINKGTFCHSHREPEEDHDIYVRIADVTKKIWKENILSASKKDANISTRLI
jgi:hypothetical protein